jgi:hypothetical protein
MLLEGLGELKNPMTSSENENTVYFKKYTVRASC